MMLLIRRFEERAGQLYGSELIAGFCHLYIGQEAVTPAEIWSTAGRLFDHLVGAGEDQRRDSEAQRLGSLRIDDQLECRRSRNSSRDRGVFAPDPHLCAAPRWPRAAAELAVV